MKKTTKKKPQCIVLLKTDAIDEPYIRYHTGLDVAIGLLVLFPRKKPVLFHSPLEKPPTSIKYETKPFTIPELESFFKAIKPTSIGYDKRHLSVGSLQILKRLCKKTSFVDASNELIAKTITKTPAQINKLKKAITLTENILQELFSALPRMKTENEAISFLKIRTLQAGAELSFKPIVASAKNACNPHYEPKKRAPLRKGFCIIDFGVRFEGFCADISRTVYLGTPSKKEKEAYAKVKAHLLMLEQNISAGTTKISSPWNIPHALGHGIGMHVHEAPVVGQDKLKKGMCIAVEPGLYTKQFGIRIEDNYVVSKNGLQRLSKSSRELKILQLKNS